MDYLPPPVLTKRDMYKRLSAGEFGNTTNQYFDLDSWVASPDFVRYELWGIRSGLAGGDKRMRLNVPASQVEPLYKEWFPNGGGNISPMIDQWAVFRAEVFENSFGEPFGLNVFYVPEGSVIDPANPWRGSFQKYGTKVSGVTAWQLLKYYLWPSDLEDMKALLDRFPDHVVEISVCDRAVGKIHNRNTIIWEVRLY